MTKEQFVDILDEFFEDNDEMEFVASGDIKDGYFINVHSFEKDLEDGSKYINLSQR